MRQTTCQRGIVFSLLMTWYGLQTHKDFFEKQRQIRVLKKISLTVKIVKNISFFFDRTPRMQTRNDGRKNKIEEKKKKLLEVFLTLPWHLSSLARQAARNSTQHIMFYQIHRILNDIFQSISYISIKSRFSKLGGSIVESENLMLKVLFHSFGINHPLIVPVILGIPKDALNLSNE